MIDARLSLLMKMLPTGREGWGQGRGDEAVPTAPTANLAGGRRCTVTSAPHATCSLSLVRRWTAQELRAPISHNQQHKLNVIATSNP